MSTTAVGRQLEDKVAKMTGGRASPSSGRVEHQADVLHPAGKAFSSWGIECKKRKTIPALFRDAFSQAASSLAHFGSRRYPAVVIEGDDGEPIFMAKLRDVVRWSDALVDVAHGQAIRSEIRNIRHSLDHVEDLAR